MKGYLVSVSGDDARSQLTSWEALVAGAVGTTIEFWGFKANQGRLWAVLYLRGRPMSAAEIQTTMGLSKGAVNTVTRELEQWGVIRRVRAPHDNAWSFEAETDLLRMVSRVVSEREARIIERVEQDLRRAEDEARRNRVPADVLERIGRMRALAYRARQAVEVFLATSRFDLRGLAKVFHEKVRAAPSARR